MDPYEPVHFWTFCCICEILYAITDTYTDTHYCPSCQEKLQNVISPTERE